MRCCWCPRHGAGTLLCACAAALLVAFLSPVEAGPPNVVVIVSDDQGSDDYGFRGHPNIRTPHLDRLAYESLTFDRGWVPTSVCCPSLATIITGLYPHQTKVTSNDPPAEPGAKNTARGSSQEMTDRWNALLDELPTLPRLLAKRGYLSFQTGKWWHGDYTRGGFTHGMTKGSRHGDAGLDIGRKGLKPIEDFVATARRENKPFFVWYAPFMPHTPHTPPERLFEKYKDVAPTPHVARYWAMCEWFDETCGELLGFLDREKLADDTIVIYVTDNGWLQQPDAARFAPKSKTSPYDFGHRTPIMVRWPGRVKPERCKDLASSIDIVPTVLDAVGVKPPAGLPGVNLLDTATRKERRYVFGECYTIRSQSLDDPAMSLLWRWATDGRWRLILPRTCEADTALHEIPADSYLTPDPRATLTAAKPLLFDILADPHETTDLAATHPRIVTELRARLNDLWMPGLAGEEAVKAKLNNLILLGRLGDTDAFARVPTCIETVRNPSPELSKTMRRLAVVAEQQRWLMKGPQEAARPLIHKTADLLRADPESTDTAIHAIIFAVGLEDLPDGTPLAIEAYTAFEPIVAASPNPKVRDMAWQFAGAKRRLQLPGQPMEIFGTLLNGEKFDPALVAGKVVLVDFWATWCGPCVAEIPAMREHYAKYRDRGFEIIGVSCDGAKDVVEEFVAKEQIPWLMFYDEGDGTWPPLAKHYGLPGIPVMILIGRDGNVVSVRARGAELSRELEKLFGDQAKPEAPAPQP
jgi:arylsulfatase A-like enzyme/thiol-disulfide isomerase/thioredoxin